MSDSSLPADVLMRIDQLCDRLAAAWQARNDGPQPRIEDYLEEIAREYRPHLFRELLNVEIEERRALGETPVAADYQDRFIDLRDHFPTLPPGPPPPTPPQQPSTTPPADAAPATVPDDPRPPVPPRYEVKSLLGRGGMAEVWLGRDRQLRRSVAIKVMQKRWAPHKDLVLRFKEEAQLTSQLQHPGIPPVHEVGTLSDGRLYFCMKVNRGKTLAELLEKRPDPSQDLPHFLGVFVQVCQAVAYAHRKAVIHRDLKPSNVMVGDFGEVQVMDWGFAKVLKDTPPKAEAPTMPGSLVETDRTDRKGALTIGALGTPEYMPPEQARGEVQRMDRRCDVFSLGAILCEVLTGQAPYLGPREDVIAHAQVGFLQPALERLDACAGDPEIKSLTRSCLCVKADDRPADAKAVADAVTTYQAAVQERLRAAEVARAAAAARAEEAQATAAAETCAREEAQAKAVAERRAKRLTFGLAAAVVLVLATGGGGGWWIQQQRQAQQFRQRDADQKADNLLEEARKALNEEWEKQDLKTARAEADKVVEVARSGASDDIRARAEAFLEEVKSKAAVAERNRRLTDALIDVAMPQEMKAYERGKTGFMVPTVSLTEEEQYAKAFRRWGVDVDREPAEQVADQLGQQPTVIVQAVVAGLDEWALVRRRARQPKGDWRRLSEVTNRLDDDPRRKEIRRIRESGVIVREQVAHAVQQVLAPTCASPVALLANPCLHPVGESLARPGIHRLRELAREMNPETEPVLGVLTLARALDLAGEASRAEGVLIAALAARPGEVVLLNALGALLARQKPPRLAEAIECFKAARAVRPEIGVKLGLLLDAARRHKEAVSILRDVQRRQPDNPETWAYLGSALCDLKDYTEAEAAIRRALQLRPDFAEAYLGLSRIRLETGRWEEAAAAIREAHKNKGDDPFILGGLGSVLLLQGKLAEAETVCRKNFELHPESPYSNLCLGMLLLAKGTNLDEAARACRLAAAAFELDVLEQPYLALAAYTILGIALAEKKDYVGATTAAYKAIELNPDNAGGYIALAAAQAKQRRFEEAVVACRRALERNPNSPEASFFLGACMSEMSKPEQAESALRKALALYPEFAEAHAFLGFFLAQQGKFDEAMKCLHKALDINKDLAIAYFGIGVCLLGMEKHGKAEAALRKALQLQPNLDIAHAMLAIVLVAQNKLDEALIAARKANDIDPDNPRCQISLAVALAGRKRLAEAEGYVRKAIELAPDLAELHMILGNILAEVGDYDRAILALRNAIKLKAGLAEAHYSLGVALSGQGKRSEAAAAFRQAILYKPNDTNTYKDLGIVLRDLGKHKEAVAAWREALAINSALPKVHILLGVAFVDKWQFAEAEAAFRQALAHKLDPAEALGVHMGLGAALVGQNKHADAIAPFRKATELNPDLLEAHLALAGVLFVQKQFGEAATPLRTAIQLKPDLREAHIMLGGVLAMELSKNDLNAYATILLHGQPLAAASCSSYSLAVPIQKQYDEAVAAIRKCIDLKPNDASGYEALAELLLLRAKHGEAEVVYQRVVQLSPNDPEAYHGLGRALHEQNKLGQAIAAYRKAVERKPDHVVAHRNLARALHDQKDLTEAAKAYSALGSVLLRRNADREAEAAFRQSIKLRASNAEVHLLLGDALYSQKKYGDAAAAYRQAIALRPKYSEAHASLGSSLLGQEDFAGAEKALGKAIELDPKGAWAHFTLGVTFHQQNKLEQAVVAFRRSIELKPNYDEALLSLGNALCSLDRLEEAVEAYRKVITLKPNDAQATFRLGVTLRMHGKREEAVTVIRRAIELKPGDADAYLALGAILIELEKFEEAEAAFRKGIEHKPGHAELNIGLGATLSLQKKYGEAEAALRKGIELKPKNAFAHFLLGNVLLEQNKFSEAVDAYRKADALDPMKADQVEAIRQAERWLDLDKRLPAILAKREVPRNAEDRIAFASFCALRIKRNVAAVRFYAEAFTAEPKFADDLNAGHRYNAICAAALAVAGKGEDAKNLPNEERFRLGQQALDWLRADLTALAKLGASGDDKSRALVHLRLTHWQQVADLTSVRDKDGLAALPEAERDRWQKLWADVDALRKQTAAKK